MKNKTGKFFGVGVGPGEVQFLTLRAVEVLRSADVVFHAVARSSERSLSGQVIAELGGCRGRLAELVFSMHHQRNDRLPAWQENAEQVVEELRQGNDCAFATIGDPLIYSTYTYLLAEVKRLMPAVEVETVPGITSFQSAAARCNQALAEDGDVLTVVPAEQLVNNGRVDILKNSDCVVVLKAYHHRERILKICTEYGLNAKGIYAAHLGSDKEVILDDLKKIGQRPNEYLSLLVLKAASG